MFITNEDIESLLVGHRISKADLVGDAGVLTLDNGDVIRVVGNEGCGGCSAGWYAVTQVAEVDNIITAVRLEAEPVSDSSCEEAYIYRIFVITGGDETEAVTVEGDDGNGYYGSGYHIDVILPA